MSKLKIIRDASIYELKRDVEKHLPHYIKGTIGNVIKLPNINIRETFIPIVTTNDKIKLPREKNDYDVDNCLFISKLYTHLTPQQASDERVWTYATHVTFYEYVRRRWPVPTGDESDKELKKRQIKHIRNHYFASSNRSLIRDNAISRLWWMGYIAYRCKTFSQEENLKILLKQSDVRANILERPNLSMSTEVFDQIISLLADSKNQDLFQRNRFREFMKKLNMSGGMRVLNALPQKTLSKLLKGIKDEIVPAKKEEG